MRAIVTAAPSDAPHPHRHQPRPPPRAVLRRPRGLRAVHFAGARRRGGRAGHARPLDPDGAGPGLVGVGVRRARRHAAVGRPHPSARHRGRRLGLLDQPAARFMVASGGGAAQTRDPAWRRRVATFTAHRSGLRAAADATDARLPGRRALDVVCLRPRARRPRLAAAAGHHLPRARRVGGARVAGRRGHLRLGGLDPPVLRRCAGATRSTSTAGSRARAGRSISSRD